MRCCPCHSGNNNLQHHHSLKDDAKLQVVQIDARGECAEIEASERSNELERRSAEAEALTGRIPALRSDGRTSVNELLHRYILIP